MNPRSPFYPARYFFHRFAVAPRGGVPVPHETRNWSSSAYLTSVGESRVAVSARVGHETLAALQTRVGVAVADGPGIF